MIGYVTLGTNDIARAGRYYDDLLSVIGAKRTMETEKFIAWGNDPKASMLFVIKPADGGPATVGNGVMVALMLGTTEKVDAFYRKAIELGGTDEGEPGPRGDSGFYAAYFRDLDGNKLNAFCMTNQS